MTVLKRPTTVMLLLLALALGYWLWFGLTQRSVDGDEGISITAAQSILKHGYQRFPSGYLYTRGYVHHYVLAGSIRVFGLNDFSIMLPSLVMGLGSLWLIYLISKDIMNRPWLGIVAAILLILTQIQTFYATSARMYMALQLFTLLATYSAWRGYIQGQRAFRYVTFVAVIAAILTHQQGLALIIAIPASIMVAVWISGERSVSLFNVQNLLFLLIAGILSLIVLKYEIPGAMPAIAAHGGEVPERVGLNSDPIVWGKHLLNLEIAVPYGLSLFPLAAYFAMIPTQKRSAMICSGLVFMLTLLAVCGFMVVAVLKGATAPRFWFSILPLYVLMISLGGALLYGLIGSSKKTVLRMNRLHLWTGLILVVGGLSVVLGLAVLTRGPKFYEILKEGYGLPCMEYVQCHKVFKRHYLALIQEVKPREVIITSNPGVTQYYVGHLDGFLREKFEADGNFSTFDHPTEEYFGIDIIDSKEELLSFLIYDRRVWIIADSKVMTFSSRETRDLLDQMYHTVKRDEILTIYVNCLELPCEVPSADRVSHQPQ